MSAAPLVSVILPTYNRADLLPRAVKSVLAQTYPCWELIIWDDGSTDNTTEVVGSYRDERLRYFRDDNHGVSYARNCAIQTARGEYIAFLDSDDEWRHQKLTAQIEALNTHPGIDVLFTDFLNVSMSSGEERRAFEQDSGAMRLLDSERVSDSMFIIRRGILESLTVENYIATDSAIVRRGAWGRPRWFAEKLWNGEDFLLWWRMGLSGACFAYLTDVCLTRYKPPGSLSGSSIRSVENWLKVLDLCTEKARARGRDDLVHHLRRQYRNAWQNLIPLLSRNGDGRAMLRAFFQSMRYGFRLGSIRLLAEAVLELGGHKGLEIGGQG